MVSRVHADSNKHKQESCKGEENDTKGTDHVLNIATACLKARTRAKKAGEQELALMRKRYSLHVRECTMMRKDARVIIVLVSFS